MLKVLSLTRIPNILPPKYELRLYDSSHDNRGYVLQTESGTRGQIRAKIQSTGMPEAEIDQLFATSDDRSVRRKSS